MPWSKVNFSLPSLNPCKKWNFLSVWAWFGFFLNLFRILMSDCCCSANGTEHVPGLCEFCFWSSALLHSGIMRAGEGSVWFATFCTCFNPGPLLHLYSHRKIDIKNTWKHPAPFHRWFQCGFQVEKRRNIVLKLYIIEII